MQSLTFVIVAALLGSTSAASLSGMKKKSMAAHDAFAQMQNVLQSSQKVMAQAEKRHKKVLKQTRKTLETVVNSNADSVGKELTQYSEDLKQATVMLAQAVNVSKAALAKSSAEPTKAGTWGTPEDTERARLTAKINTAERTLRRADSKNNRAVQEAAETAEGSIEDTTAKLARKLGDISPVVDKAKAVLEAKAAAPAVVAANKTATNATVSGSGEALLTSAEKVLDVAVSKNKADSASGTKRMNAVLDKSGKSLLSQVKSIEQSLQQTEKDEIKKIRR